MLTAVSSKPKGMGHSNGSCLSLISIDTETTGVDCYHGSRPFYVTSCTETGRIKQWQWAVDPKTRLPQVVPKEVNSLWDWIDSATEIVGHNIKFDVKALIALDPIFSAWPWEKTHDTLIAGHVLGSNLPKDLGSMSVMYLGENIKPLEDELEAATQECRRIVRKRFPHWSLAAKDAPGMPSAKGECWRNDTWLPRLVAATLKYQTDHPFYSVLSKYSNRDGEITTALWLVVKQLLKKQGLWEIYLEQRRLPQVIEAMESRGVTTNLKRMGEVHSSLTKESFKLRKQCTTIASLRGYQLKLPKGAMNKSLQTFAFGNHNGLALAPYLRSEKTGTPSLKAAALDHYRAVLPYGSDALEFISALSLKRKKDTALSYEDSYYRHGIPYDNNWLVLHSSYNQTGSDTLRFSCSNPNAQNVSKKEEVTLRYIFGPLPGREWWALDYENIELRIPAYEADERAMIELFEKPDEPPYWGSYHYLNCSIVYPDEFWPLAKIRPDLPGSFKSHYKNTLYQSGKNGGFAKQYSGGRPKVDATFKRPGAYDAINDKLNKVEALNQSYIQYARRHGYVETLPDRTLGCSRSYPLLCTRDERGKIKPTVPFPYHVQGTAMQCTRKAMPRCHQYLENLNQESSEQYYLILQCHDELLFDFPSGGRKNLPKVKRLQRLMEQSGDDIGIPLRVAISYHPNNWRDSEEY